MSQGENLKLSQACLLGGGGEFLNYRYSKSAPSRYNPLCLWLSFGFALGITTNSVGYMGRIQCLLHLVLCAYLQVSPMECNKILDIGACRGTFDPVAGSIVASCYRINCSKDTGFQHEKVGSLKSALPKTLQEVMEVIWKRDWW